MERRWFICFLLLCCFFSMTLTKKADPKNKPAWAKKNILDMDEADMERLLDQWEEDDDPLPLDELPEYKRPPNQPNIDFGNMKNYSPDEIMKLTKKGKTIMMFVNLNGDPTREECESISSLWQGALRNDHIQTERYVIDDSRVIFLFHDGAQAWDAKAFFLEQERVKDITLEGQQYNGNKNKPSVSTPSSSKAEL